MKQTNKSQITVIEVTLVAVLFAFTIPFLFTGSTPESSDYKYFTDSLLDTIHKNESYRSVFMDESLAAATRSEDWSAVLEFLNKSVTSYELVIANESVREAIVECTPSDFKYLSERIIAIEDNDNYEIRKLMLGVCH